MESHNCATLSYTIYSKLKSFWTYLVGKYFRTDIFSTNLNLRDRGEKRESQVLGKSFRSAGNCEVESTPVTPRVARYLQAPV